MINAQTLDLIPSRSFRFAILPVLILFLNGCALMRNLQVESWPFAAAPRAKIEKNYFSISGDDDVIGRIASVRVQKGDTLPDIARHFGLGVNEISAANPGVDIWAPESGERIVLPLMFILPDAPRRGIVINLAAMRLFQYKKGGGSLTVATYPVGVGTVERPTPMGQTYVMRKVTRPVWHVPASIAEDHRRKGDPLPSQVPPGPENPLGDYAMYLKKSSYLIHGTNKPASIGLRATNGCLRLFPEDIKRLYESTPVNSPVNIIYQPYLVGRSGSVVYLEIHAPLEKTDRAELEKMFAKLRKIEKGAARPLDWDKVNAVLAEARGIPVPVFDTTGGSRERAEETVEVRHPEKLYGKPEIPEIAVNAWYVLAADLRSEMEAVRLAAIINHQGPPIPARVISKGETYRVIAGPFKDSGGARDAARRLKIDLELDGIMIAPDGKR